MPAGKLFKLDHIFDEDVLLFLLIVETKGFSQAAQTIGRNQSSVSKRIFELEDALGVALFDRSQRPIRPTPEGRVFYHQVKRQIGALSAIVEKLKLQNSLKPVIRIGCVESLSLDLVPQLIKRLMPETTQISQITATSNTLLKLLLEHKLDIIITCDRFSNVKGLHRRFLFSEPSVVLMSKAMASSKKDQWSWSDLMFSGKPFINYTLESGGGKLNESYFNSLYMPLTNQLEVDGNTVMMSLIRDNIGWTLGRATTLVQTKHLVDGVVAVPMPEPLVVRKIYFMTRETEDSMLVNTCYSIIADIIKNEIFPKLKAAVPWATEYVQDQENFDPTANDQKQ